MITNLPYNGDNAQRKDDVNYAELYRQSFAEKDKYKKIMSTDTADGGCTGARKRPWCQGHRGEHPGGFEQVLDQDRAEGRGWWARRSRATASKQKRIKNRWVGLNLDMSISLDCFSGSNTMCGIYIKGMIQFNSNEEWQTLNIPRFCDFNRIWWKCKWTWFCCGCWRIRISKN